MTEIGNDVDGLALQLGQSDDAIIRASLERARFVLGRSLTEVMAGLTVEDLEKAACITGGGNSDFKFGALSRIIFSQDLAAIKSRTHAFSQLGRLLDITVKRIVVSEFGSEKSGDVQWNGEKGSVSSAIQACLKQKNKAAGRAEAAAAADAVM